MTDDAPSTPEQIARQAKQHLDSLRAAGVEWLPDTPTPIIVAAARGSPPAETVAVQRSRPLIDEAGGVEATAMTVVQRTEELGKLARRVSQCTRCAALASSRTQTVFGVGALDAELCFIGEAP